MGRIRVSSSLLRGRRRGDLLAGAFADFTNPSRSVRSDGVTIDLSQAGTTGVLRQTPSRQCSFREAWTQLT